MNSAGTWCACQCYSWSAAVLIRVPAARAALAKCICGQAPVAWLVPAAVGMLRNGRLACGQVLKNLNANAFHQVREVIYPSTAVVRVTVACSQGSCHPFNVGAVDFRMLATLLQLHFTYI